MGLMDIVNGVYAYIQMVDVDSNSLLQLQLDHLYMESGHS